MTLASTSSRTDGRGSRRNRRWRLSLRHGDRNRCEGEKIAKQADLPGEASSHAGIHCHSLHLHLRRVFESSCLKACVFERQYFGPRKISTDVSIVYLNFWSNQYERLGPNKHVLCYNSRHDQMPSLESPDARHEVVSLASREVYGIIYKGSRRGIAIVSNLDTSGLLKVNNYAYASRYCTITW